MSHVFFKQHTQSAWAVLLRSADDKFTFHGVWMITKLDQQSDEVARVSMISMPHLPCHELSDSLRKIACVA